MNTVVAIPPRVSYPSVSGLFQGQHPDVYTSLLPQFFQDKNYKIVVAAVLHGDTELYLVQPAKAPPGMQKYIFPQETAEWGRDRTIRDVLMRGLSEELGLAPKDVIPQTRCLTWYENRVPTIRTGGERQTKCIVYVGVKVKPTARITLNSKEIRDMARVASSDDYYAQAKGLEECRPEKWTGQLEAVLRLVAHTGALPGKQWSEFRRFARTCRIH